MDENEPPGWLGEDPSRDDDRGPITGKDEELLKDEELPAPVDLRDTYGAAGESIGEASATVAVDVEMPEAGPYPLPEEIERPNRAQDPAAIRQPTVDPSLSRAADRAAAGLDPDALGYDRSIEGPPPGPLGPDAELEDAAADEEPAGQWGSSGSTP